MKSSAPASRVQRPLRTGFTTGACSAAAAQAAARCLAQGARLASIESRLPNGQTVNFTLHQSRPTTHGYICSIIKDGGDDPDATHGAELVAHVTLRTDSELIIKGGAGVATVTRPGLGLPVGTSAINPVPRRSIMELVGQELAPLACGAEVEISVPDGLAMATHTLNSRLGLIGGISILGTTGIVRPYSTAAYKASVVQAVDVAADSQAQHLVLTTGGKSETYAMALHPQLPEPAFIQVGDFIGLGLRAAHRRAISQVSIVGMVGKLSKMAGGVMQTHQAGSRVDPEFLATLCAEAGGSLALCASVRTANTARHALELCQAAGLSPFASSICKRVAGVASQHAHTRGPRAAQRAADVTWRRLRVQVQLVDFDGQLLGEAHHE